VHKNWAHCGLSLGHPTLLRNTSVFRAQGGHEIWSVEHGDLNRHNRFCICCVCICLGVQNTLTAIQLEFGGVPTPQKNMSQLGLLFPIHGKIKAMFQTTSQEFVIQMGFNGSHDVSRIPLNRDAWGSRRCTSDFKRWTSWKPKVHFGQLFHQKITPMIEHDR